MNTAENEDGESSIPPPTPPQSEPSTSPNPPEVPPTDSAPPTTPPAEPPAADGPQPKDANEKTLGLVMHLLQLSGILLAKIPFVGIVAPLILWLVKRNESPYLDAVGKEVINFQINLGVAVFVGLLACIVPGIIIGIGGLVLVVIAAMKTNEGGPIYRYPWIYRIIK